MSFLNGMYQMPEDVTKENFRAEVEGIFSVLGFNAGYVIHGKSIRGKKEPIAFSFARIDGHRMEAHIHFFFFASDRNKLEGEIKFIQEMRQMYTIIHYALPMHERMFDHICRYGIARRVGTIYEYTDDLKEVIVYQSRST
jgi:hypothetical protein